MIKSITRYGYLLQNIQQFSSSRNMELKLHRPHLDEYFDGDTTKIQKQIKEMSRRYSLDSKSLQKLFKLTPKTFIENSSQRQQLQNKIKYLNQLEQTKPVARILNQLLFDSNHLLLNMNLQDIQYFVNYLHQNGIDQKYGSRIFGVNKNLIHGKFDLIYQEKLNIFKDYLDMNQEDINKLFVKEPFLLACSANRLRDSLVFFVQKRGKYLTNDQIKNLIQKLGQIFLMGRKPLSQIVRTFASWGVEKQQVWKILMEHPLLWLNHPRDILDYKKKMFKLFRFTAPMGQLLLRQHPSALICSVRSLQSKLLTARDRLRITLSQQNLQYLTFKYSANIRPRSQMLIRAKIPFTSQSIIEYLNCSDKEFIRKTQIPEQKLLQQKYKYNISSQLDIPNRKCLQNYKSKQKIYEMAKRYYPISDLKRKKKGK